MYVISCSRDTKLVEYDDDTYTDRYGEEADEAEREVDDCVEYRDGSWVFDMGYGWCPGSATDRHPVDKPTPGLTRSPGVVRVFSSLAAANAAAALVWQSLQVNHGFDGVVPDAGDGPQASKGRGGMYQRQFVFEYDDGYEDEGEDEVAA
ncbi:hypothetical protein OEZ86_013031 [Tetradesmus obliquus]|nr:hypothetical protein OEZ86_013031 [Tetradesmus obliquus]